MTGNETFSVDHANKTILVCGWCHPGTSLLRTQPKLAGVSYYKFSHGVCAQCSAAMKRDIVRLNLTRQPVTA